MKNILILLCGLWLFQNGKTDIESTVLSIEHDTTIYEIVEEMPRFPGCEEMEGNIDEKKQCADKKMLEFIFKNLSYPALSDDCDITKMIILEFIVDEKGKLINPKLNHDMCPLYQKEWLRLVALMNEMPPWIPGKQRGKAVKVKMRFPLSIKFDF